MPDQATHAQPLWVIIVLALLTSTVPSYMSYLASKQTIDERGKDVGVASVDRTRDILEPVIVDLSRRVGEINGRLEAMQASAGAAPVAVVPHARPPHVDGESGAGGSSAPAPAADSAAGASPQPSASTTPTPARRGGLSASALHTEVAPVLPKRAPLTPAQLQISREISQAIDRY